MGASNLKVQVVFSYKIGHGFKCAYWVHLDCTFSTSHHYEVMGSGNLAFLIVTRSTIWTAAKGGGTRRSLYSKSSFRKQALGRFHTHRKSEKGEFISGVITHSYLSIHINLPGHQLKDMIKARKGLRLLTWCLH